MALKATLENAETKVKAKSFGMRDKMGYMFGEIADSLFFLLVSAFLMVYYTDIFGLNPAFVGTLFLVARLWDGLVDIVWGRFIDTRKSGKHGKFRPWILRMSFPVVISGILMFIYIPGQTEGFYAAYAFVSYMLYSSLFSTVAIPYGAMASVISSNPDERTSLSTFRSLGMTLAMLIVNVGAPLLMFVDNKADPSRFLMGAVIFGVVSLSCYVACYNLSVERITTPEDESVKSSLKETFKGIIKNRPLICVLLATATFLITMMTWTTVNVYLFKDYFGHTAAMSIIGVVQPILVFIAMPLIKPLVSKYGKKEVVSIGLLLSSAVFFLLYFLPNINAVQYIAIMTVAMFGFTFFTLLMWAFVTDGIDYHEYITGLREDGTVYSIYSIARRIGQAVAGAVGGFAIGAIGYNSALGSQAQETLDGIHSLATLLPAVGYLIMFLILGLIYPLNKNRTNQLAADLKERREANI